MAYVETKNATIYYEVYGDGPAVAFAHGAGGNAASWWQQVPEFSKNYKVIVFDHRLYGRSKCTPDDFDYGEFSNDFRAILDAEGIDKCAIVCQSMGGRTGLSVAMETPDRVPCLILSNTAGGILTDKIKAIQDTSQGTRPAGLKSRALAADFVDKSPEKHYLYMQLFDLNAQITPEIRKQLESKRTVIDPASLKNFAVPTLCITSPNDVIFPPAAIKEVAAILNAEMVELPEAGHSPYFETPDAFNETVRGFLAQHI